MAYDQIPYLIKHCTVAIYREGGVLATSQKDRFIQAFKIAKSKMAEYGFVRLGGSGLMDMIMLTPKGLKRELHHKKEGRAKNVLFDTLFAKYDLDGSKAAAKKAQNEKVASIQANEEEQKKAGLTQTKKVQTKTKPKTPKPTKRNTI